MKKIISMMLAFAMLLPLVPQAEAFTDINEPVAKTAAEGLSSIGVVADVDNFYPDMSLTRAQFCKMAVLAAGFDEASMYSSYTLYPDVKSGAWYAPFVNAAVRKYQIIKAYPSGFFGPDDSITYGQAITILLRMLGWKDSEVGAFWPRDFIIKADEIGLTRGMKSFNQDAAIPRSEAAILISNMLMMNSKDGGSFINQGFGALSGAVLTATDETDPSLNANEAVILANGEKTVYKGVSLPHELVGMYGTAVLDKNDSSKLIGFIADTRGASVVTVKSADDSGIATENGKIYIGRDVPVYVQGASASYITSWFDIRPQSQVMIFRDSKNAISFVSVMTAVSTLDSIVYGTESFTPVSNARFLHNGSYIDRSKLKKYDVLSYSKADNTYRVSDDALILKLDSAGPVYKSPDWIEAGGIRFNVPAHAAAYFENIKPGQVVSLLLDHNGNIAAAFSGTNGKAPTGILTKLDDSGNFEVKLNSGITLSGSADLSSHGTMNVDNTAVTALYKSFGRFVTVAQKSDGKFKITPVAMSKSGLPFGSNTDLAGERFADSVRVYEQIGSNYPVHAVSGVTSLPTASIVHTETDRNGKINLIIANDITGDHYIYGMVSQTVETITTGYGFDGEAFTRDVYSLTIKNGEGEKVFRTFVNPGFSYNAVPGKLAKDAFEGGKFTNVPAEKLSVMGNVNRDAFDGVKGVRVGDSYYSIHEDAPVYSADLKRFISLSEARANFTSFTLYGTGRVCMIVVK